MDINLQKEKHQDRIQKKTNIHDRLLKQALKNYNKQFKYGVNVYPQLQEYNFKLLKPFYFQLKDHFKGHWQKQLPKFYNQEKKEQKKEKDLNELI